MLEPSRLRSFARRSSEQPSPGSSLFFSPLLSEAQDQLESPRRACRWMSSTTVALDACQARNDSGSLTPSFTGLVTQLRAGDVLLGDRGFCSFAHLALLAARGVHGVFRIHQRQIVDFTPHRAHVRPGRKKVPPGLPRSRWLRELGLRDQVVAWLKPEGRPDGMSAEQYASLPAELAVRELRYRTGRAGFRVRQVTLVTTLVDAEVYPLVELAELYRKRWEAETNLKHLKTTMKMDVLR